MKFILLDELVIPSSSVDDPIAEAAGEVGEGTPELEGESISATWDSLAGKVASTSISGTLAAA